MKRVLITGGTGSIGRAFIKKYYSDFDFYIVSRDVSRQYQLHQDFPKITTFPCAVEHRSDLFRIFDKVLPDIVVHFSANKYIDVAETYPIEVIKTNVIGSLNIIEASLKFNVLITVAISTDKACECKSVYGASKFIMERMVLEANGMGSKFAVCRFGNVAFTENSVLPFWFAQKSRGEPLKVTDESMNRLMFSLDEASELVFKAIQMCENGDSGFVLAKKMKVVNIRKLAMSISSNYTVVGSRQGEKLDEVLVSKAELPFTEVDGNFIKIRMKRNEDVYARLGKYYGTDTAQFMTDEEIKKLLSEGGR